MNQPIVSPRQMKTYSPDFRTEIVTAYKNNEGSMLKLACRYGVSRSFVQKIIQQERTIGHIFPLGRKAKTLSLSSHTELIKKLKQDRPDATLRELCQALKDMTGLEVSHSTMWRFLRKIERENL